MTCGELMTPAPTCCQPNHTVVDAAEMMQREDVGLLPVIDEQAKKVVGVLTDRDIVLKVVAAGHDPRQTAVRDVMTSNPIVGQAHDSVDAVMELMAAHQVRRIPIVDKAGAIIGIVAQADIATRVANTRETGEVVQAISEPAAT